MTRAGNGFWSDFQKFLMRGNVIDLAVAVVIGGAFGKIVTSLVEDIITPAILSPVLQRLHLNDLQQLSVNGIKYGVFLAAVLNFLVITLSIFVVIRAFEKSRRRVWRQEAADAEAAPPDPNVILQEKTANALDRLSQALETRSL